MKILFVNMSATRFTVETPELEPLGGTESCIAYLARQLVENGHQISLVAHLPSGTDSKVRGVYHYSLESLKQPEFLTRNPFDVIIVCNAALLCPVLKGLSPNSQIILWTHVPPDQPSVKNLGNSDVLRSIDCIAYVSEWQKQQTESYFKFQKQSFVIGNGLTPSFENMFSSPTEILNTKKNRAVYTTIPYRGLSILLKAMTGLNENTELDLFSSMRVYQLSDDEYESLYREAKQNPYIHSHGSVTQTLLASHLKEASFLTYPCICAETFCIGALEALAGGLKVISTNLGALPSTTMGYADLLDVSMISEEDLVIQFREIISRNVNKFIEDPIAWSEERYDQIQAVNRQCTWPVRTISWQNKAQELLQKTK